MLILGLVIPVLFSMLGGCAGGKQKPGVRNYEGDTSPNIRMYEEKPGYPVNPH